MLKKKQYKTNVEGYQIKNLSNSNQENWCRCQKNVGIYSRTQLLARQHDKTSMRK